MSHYPKWPSLPFAHGTFSAISLACTATTQAVGNNHLLASHAPTNVAVVVDLHNWLTTGSRVPSLTTMQRLLFLYLYFSLLFVCSTRATSGYPHSLSPAFKTSSSGIPSQIPFFTPFWGVLAPCLLFTRLMFVAVSTEVDGRCFISTCGCCCLGRSAHWYVSSSRSPYLSSSSHPNSSCNL